MSEKVSAAKFAAIIGVSKVRVGQAIKSGKLSASVETRQRGKNVEYTIDVELGRAEWQGNNGRPELSPITKAESTTYAKRKDEAPSQPPAKVSNPVVASKPKKTRAKATARQPPPPPPLAADPPTLGTGPDPDGDDDPLDGPDGQPLPSNIASQRALNFYKAEKARREHLIAEGSLVPIAEVGDMVRREYGIVRKALVSLGVDLAQELAILEDEHAIKARIDEAINEILQALQADQHYDGKAADVLRAG